MALAPANRSRAGRVLQRHRLHPAATFHLRVFLVGEWLSLIEHLVREQVLGPKVLCTNPLGALDILVHC